MFVSINGQTTPDNGVGERKTRTWLQIRGLAAWLWPPETESGFAAHTIRTHGA